MRFPTARSNRWAGSGSSAGQQLVTAGWARLLVAAGGGLLLSAAFPPLGWWFTAPFGVAAITLACRGGRLRAAVAAGYVGGLAFFLTSLAWVSVVGTDAWLLLAVVCAGWFAGIGAATWAVSRIRWWPVATAAIWVSTEALRATWPLGGFSWGRLGFSQADSPLASLASIGGITLVGFVVALIGTLLAAWMYSLAQSGPAGPGWWLLAAAMGLMVVGLAVPLPTTGETLAGPNAVTAAVVQGGVPRAGLDAMGQRRQVLDNHVVATERLGERIDRGEVPRADLVVWPENSSDIDPLGSPKVAESITRAARAVAAPILVGAVVEQPGAPLRLLNVGMVWDPNTGAGPKYIKRHLVPFGEYVPFRSFLTGFISRFERVPFDFAPGHDSGVLRIGSTPVGDVICFEIADDAIVRDSVESGARILVVQTNNATYADTAQPWQQLAMSRLRAIEQGRTVLVAATSGVTAIVAPDGRIAAQAGFNRSQSLVEQVPLRDSRTIASRVGGWTNLIFGLVVLLALALAIRASMLPRLARGAAGSAGAESGKPLESAGHK